MPVRPVVALLLACCFTLGCSSGPDRDRTAQARQALSPQAALLLTDAQRAYQRGDYLTVLQLTDSAARQAPDLADIYFLQGLALTQMNRYVAADTALARVVALDPYYKDGWFTLGQNAFLQGQYRRALAAYQEEAARAEAPSPTLLLQIGRAYVYLGRPDSARLHYDRALTLTPNHALGLAWLSELEAQAGDLAPALTHARQASNLDPENPERTYDLAALLVRVGDAGAAIPLLEKVIQQQPWHAGAHYNLGRALLSEGRAAEARPFLAATDSLQALHSAIALAQLGVFQNPEDRQRWHNLARLLRQAGRTDEARQALRIARMN